MRNFVTICLSIIALILSLCAICYVFPSQRPVNFDYQGLLVGVLSLLVTGILGWQIYNVLTAEARIKRLSKLYQDIYSKSEEIETGLSRAMAYMDAKASYIETAIYNHIDLKNNTANIVTLCNDYIRMIEALDLYLRANNTKYPSQCLVFADEILSYISEMIKKGYTLNPSFNEICDKIYKELVPNILILESGDIDFLHKVRARRKSLSSDHPLPPATNPWGIQTSENRVRN